MASIDDLLDSLGVFDLRDLAAGVGALQLMPENADHLLRIERLAGLVASLAPSSAGAPQMSPGRWRKIINGPPIADSSVVSNEDPFEEPYTASISFYGGSYTVMAGLATGAVRIARRLTEALFAVTPELDRAFVHRCGRLTRGLLVLADAISDRAGLQRATAPLTGKGEPAVVPPGEHFSQLKEAVRWRWSDLDGLLGTEIAQSLKQLAVAPGELSPPTEDQSFDDIAISVRPILDFGDELVALMPTGLLTALRHWILVAAGEHGVRDELAERYREATLRDVGRSLWTAGFRNAEERASSTAIVEQLWQFDDDKVAHLVVITDPLTNYSAAEPFGRWADDALSERVERLLLTARKDIRAAHGPETGVLHLIVLEGVGRWIHLGLTSASSARRAYSLTLTSDDLEILSRQEFGDPLAIWKFARAADQLRNQSRVFQWSTLDEYAIYLDHERSFYFGDDRRPTFVNIQNASATQLRIDDAVGFDAHAALHPRSQAAVHVQRRYQRSDVPIYATDPLGDPVDLLVELNGFRVWIVSDDDDRTPSDRHLYFELKEAVAYWLWQIAEADDAVTAGLAGNMPELVVRIVILEGDAWTDADVADDREWVVLGDGYHGPTVTFAPSTNAALSGPDNRGERHLVALLLGMLHDLAGVDEPIDPEAVDHVAPLGPKKKVVVLAGNDNLALMPGDLPHPRLVDDADVALRLDEMGEWLSATRSVGRVGRDERVALLNGVVAYYFERLEEAVARLQPVGLFEFLIGQNESLIRDEAERRLTLPTRIACFGLEDEARKDLTERLPKLVVSAVASRFLIEFVAASPPNGSERITLERYDELLSIASEVVNKGYASDAIYFGLSDIEVSVLASGRLGLSREDTYQRALDTFRAGNVRSQVRSARDRFAQHWRAPSPASPPDYLAALQTAFAAEFGVTLSEHAEFAGTVINVGLGLAGEAKGLPIEHLSSRIGDTLGWPHARVAGLLERFGLTERDSFLAGPLCEIYPWRYGRDLSYLRRPFVVTPGSNGYVWWGTRHLDNAGRALVDVILTGRLKAQSAEMKRFMGTIRASEPEVFNDEVAAFFAELAGHLVNSRVKKVGGLRIARSNGEDIGDIDVLVVDLERHQILAIETKDFEKARTPSELAREVEKLVAGPKSACHLHSERVRWLQDHSKDVVEWLGLTGAWPKWRVDGLIVVSSELMSPLLAESKFPIVTLTQLRARGARSR